MRCTAALAVESVELDGGPVLARALGDQAVPVERHPLVVDVGVVHGAPPGLAHHIGDVELDRSVLGRLDRDVDDAPGRLALLAPVGECRLHRRDLTGQVVTATPHLTGAGVDGIEALAQRRPELGDPARIGVAGGQGPRQAVAASPGEALEERGLEQVGLVLVDRGLVVVAQGAEPFLELHDQRIGCFGVVPSGHLDADDPGPGPAPGDPDRLVEQHGRQTIEHDCRLASRDRGPPSPRDPRLVGIHRDAHDRRSQFRHVQNYVVLGGGTPLEPGASGATAGSGYYPACP